MQENPNLIIARLGVEAEQWWLSDVGRFIAESIQKDIEANLEILKTAEGEDVKKTQGFIMQLEYLPKRINDLIMAGNAAIQIMESEDN